VRRTEGRRKMLFYPRAVIKCSEFQEIRAISESENERVKQR
jgi:hypothetical protein